MSDSLGDELLAAIAAAPDDRALRLVYADWLMERGDARGEWIALSCGRDTEDTTQEMRRRALWQHHGQQWKSIDHAQYGLSDIEYRNGFPEAAYLYQHPPVALHRPVPPLRTLKISVGDVTLGALTNSPFLEAVRRVELVGPVPDVGEEEFVAFLNAPALARLEGLTVWMERDGDALWPALARFERLGELKQFEFHGALGVEQARWLGRACPALEALAYYDAVPEAGLRALIETSTFRLRELTVGLYEVYGNDREPEWRDAVRADTLQSSLARELTSLSLEVVAFGPRTAGALAQLPCAARLRHLSLRARNDPTILGGLEDSQFPVLEQLILYDLQITDDVIESVTRCSALETVSLVFGALTPAGIEGLVSALPRLEQLGLGGVSIGDEGVAALATSAHACSLRQLWLGQTGVGDAAVSRIVDSSRFTELRELDLGENRLGDAAIRSLAHGPFDYMSRLCVGPGMGEPTRPLFAERWIELESWGASKVYERKLELSGRAVR